MIQTRYDAIGTAYNNTRKADPYITDRLYALLDAAPDGHCLDIGCGTGNYLKALSERGLHFTGVDPSLTMLEQAKDKFPQGRFLQAKAEQLPLSEETFDGAIATLTLHHWEDMTRGLQEVLRVLKPGAHLVCFSFTPQQMSGYWLYHYFPEMIANSSALAPERETMVSIFCEAGFSSVTTENYFVRDDLQDHFLLAGKRHPEWYLDPAFRENMSAFRLFADDKETIEGLRLLESDIISGRVNQVMESYENDLGDYLFYIAQKKS